MTEEELDDLYIMHSAAQIMTYKIHTFLDGLSKHYPEVYKDLVAAIKFREMKGKEAKLLVGPS